MTRTPLRPECAMMLYLCGPMTGYPEYNFPAFHAAAARLRGLGHDVWSPAELSVAEGFAPAWDEAKPHAYYMRHDLVAILDADGVALLPCWMGSRGARLEVHCAIVCGRPLFDALDMSAVSHDYAQHHIARALSPL